MDTFELVLQDADPDLPGLPGALVPRINGEDLIERVRSLELAGGEEKLAGSYGGLRLDRLRSVRDHYLGSPAPLHRREDGKVPILGCSCGIVDCWPLHVRITVAEEVVTWDGFDPPFRPDPERDVHRLYAAFGPFRFDRTRYEAELDRFPRPWGVREPA